MKTLEDLVKEQIENLDIQELVSHQIKKLISDDVKREITKYTQEEVKRLIAVEIEICLSKGVETDDGWGNKKSYTSFEELFKKHFAETLKNSYEIRRNIEDYIKGTTKKLVEEKTREISDALLKSLTSTPK